MRFKNHDFRIKFVFLKKKKKFPVCFALVRSSAPYSKIQQQLQTLETTQAIDLNFLCISPCITQSKSKDFSKKRNDWVRELTIMFSCHMISDVVFLLLTGESHAAWHCPIPNQLVNLTNSCHLSIEWRKQ